MAIEGYKSVNAAPALGHHMSGVADYLAIHNMILAHASAYDVYKKKYKSTQNGKLYNYFKQLHNLITMVYSARLVYQ